MLPVVILHHELTYYLSAEIKFLESSCNDRLDRFDRFDFHLNVKIRYMLNGLSRSVVHQDSPSFH
jgi:hypothetical protein